MLWYWGIWTRTFYISFISDIAWIKKQLGSGDNNNMLDSDEMMRITADLTATNNAVGAKCAFSIIVVMPSGASLTIDGYPSNRNDGAPVYFGTGTCISDTGLSPGTPYHYLGVV